MRCLATCMYAVLQLVVHDFKLVSFWSFAAVPIVNTNTEHSVRASLQTELSAQECSFCSIGCWTGTIAI